MNSKYVIQRNHDMVIGIAERWCSETNTCIFPWGEATLTLEDTMVLGGLSVLGEPVYRPVQTQELKEIEQKLYQARAEAIRSKARKACPHFWIKEFMNSGSEIEHEAFLVFWLSMFVLPNSRIIRQQVFPVTIHLAKGTRIALAPAVLASIYRDLSSLKKAIVALNNFCPGEDKNRVFEEVLRSPLQLVQLWAWERFPSLQPKRNLVICGEPAFARWHKVESVKIDNVRLTLDSAGNGFLWRPYASYTYNRAFPKLYGEKGMWVPVDPNLDGEIESFARFLRVSELVGLEYIEHYFPHRVAMQFGIDQDLPGYVARCNKSPETAWSNYSKPISDVKLYVPSRISKGDVSTRYLEWWKQSIRERSMKAVDQALQAAKGNDDDVPPGFPLNCNNVDKPMDMEDETIPKQVFQASMGKKGGTDADVPPDFPPKCNAVNVDEPSRISKGDVYTRFLEWWKQSIRERSMKIVDQALQAAEGNDGNVPPGFPPKCNNVDKPTDVKDETIPKQVFSTRFLEWWKQSIGESQRRMKIVDQALQAAKGNDGDVPPGFPPKCNNVDKPMDVEDETIPKQVFQASMGKKGGTDADVPPGVRPKCNPVNVDEPTILEDKTMLKQVLLLQASMGKKRGNDGDVPPGFPPKCNKVENSVNEVKSAGEGMRSYGHFLGQSQSFSASVEKEGAVRKMESMTKNRGEAEVGGLERAIRSTSESQAGNLVYNMVSINGNEGECSSDTLEIPVLDLETRISKLERVVAELKRARFSRRSEK
jgi:hypothetical protein